VRVLRSTADSLSCVLFPASCAICDSPLLRLNQVPVCTSCWNKLVPQQGSLCTVCGENLGIASFWTPLDSASTPSDRGNALCRPCSLAPPAFEKAVAFGNYEGALRSLIHLLKYERMRPAAAPLAKLLAKSLRDLGRHNSASQILVIPVPLHRSKQRSRGFNQADLLARALISSLRSKPGWNLQLGNGLLKRTRATESQAGLSMHQRRRNLRGAFVAPEPKALDGRHVILIDDVYTTGATARACSRVLMDSGAASVLVATVARAQREGTAMWDAHTRHSTAS
jgi:ComF family protein